MFYTAGPVQTAFVVAPTDLIGSVFVRGISRISNTEVTVDIVGYFARPKAAALDCVTTAAVSSPIAAGANVQLFPNGCAAGYTQVGVQCGSTNFQTNLALVADNQGCGWHNSGATSANVNT